MKLFFVRMLILSVLCILTVSTHTKASSDDVVYILQGEPGPQGDPGADGADGRDGKQGPPGEGLVCSEEDCFLSNGNNLVVEGNVEAVVGIFGSFEVDLENQCPIGYSRDPDEEGIILCKKPVGEGRFDEMVKVGSYWIDKYEISVWPEPDCTGEQYGGAQKNWDIPPNGSSFAVKDIYGCSIRDEIPSRITTWFQAMQSCLAAGKSLCTNSEWQMAALGTPDEDTEIPLSTPSCNIWNGLLPAHAADWAVDEKIVKTGSAAECISNLGANDMIGNLAEWTAEWVSGGWTWMKNDSTGAFAWPKDLFNNDGTWGINGSPYNGTEYKNGLPAAIVRGGEFSDGSSAGAYAVSFINAPSTTEWRFGARCCRHY